MKMENQENEEIIHTGNTVEYGRWLQHHKGDLDPHNQYNLLFRDLRAFVFVSIVDHDYNRVYEALSVRYKFKGYSGMPDEYVSILEIILTMAIKCEEVSFDAKHTNTVVEWFWQLLGNLGLDKFIDSDYIDLGGAEVVEGILFRFVTRRHCTPNGEGGIFPLKNTNLDQRFVDLFYQMREYVEENYY